MGDVGAEQAELQGEVCPTVVAAEKVDPGSWSRSLEEKWEVVKWSSCCAYPRRSESPIPDGLFNPFCFEGEGGLMYWDGAASSIFGREILSGLVTLSRAGWSEVAERMSDIFEAAEEESG